jgi:hypothetical protein
VKEFGLVYKDYYSKYSCRIPRSYIDGFYKKSQAIVLENGIVDLYKEALEHLMIGCVFHPQDETIFWQLFVNSELETHLWF